MASIDKSNPLARRRAGPRLALAAFLSLGAAACSGQISQHGYVASDTALDQIQIGSSREQVRLIMGTPTTTGAVEGDAYYYISEVREQRLFFAPEIIDRRVLVFYFDNDARLSRIANYGLKDGKLFDFITRSTPTMNSDKDLIQQIIGGLTLTP